MFKSNTPCDLRTCTDKSHRFRHCCTQRRAQREPPSSDFSSDSTQAQCSPASSLRILTYADAASAEVGACPRWKLHSWMNFTVLNSARNLNALTFRWGFKAVSSFIGMSRNHCSTWCVASPLQVRLAFFTYSTAACTL